MVLILNLIKLKVWGNVCNNRDDRHSPFESLGTIWKESITPKLKIVSSEYYNLLWPFILKRATSTKL